MLPTTLRRTGRGYESPLDAFQDEFNRALTRWWGGDGGETSMTGIYPVDIREDNDHIFVDAELPGFRREEVQVTLENGMLSINAERQSRPEDEKGEKHLSERRFMRVSRSFTLPTSVDETKVDAKLTDGVLRLTLNKREEVKPRRIEVK